ncbi:MAG: Mur ligase domain-containing protein, partial [Chitinispirillia bacterium]
MKLSDLITGIKILKQSGSVDPEVCDLTYDSRAITKGAVFVAIPGLKVNGERFIGEAVLRGAS